MGLYNDLSRREHNERVDVAEQYFHWLCSKIGVEREGNTYRVLAHRLHSIDYKWFVENDDNRGEDGMKFRELFIEDQGLGFSEWNVLNSKPCSVLEMLIGVSTRMGDMLDSTDEDDHFGIRKWFWELINNLELTYYTDGLYYSSDSRRHLKVEEIIQTLLDRSYGRNGVGGLFPLRFPRGDQRKVELWYQMDAYIRERYSGDF
jgi:hypothetical protein